VESPRARRALSVLRRRIDALDCAVARLLSRRLRLVRALRPFKSRIPDPRRELEVLANVGRQAGRSGAEREFVASVYRGLLRASRAFQKREKRAGP